MTTYMQPFVNALLIIITGTKKTFQLKWFIGTALVMIATGSNLPSHSIVLAVVTGLTLIKTSPLLW